jgi:hypothetical protein
MLTGTAWAGLYDYRCKVIDTREVNKKGSFENTKLYMGAEFSVSRSNGAIIGMPFPNTSFGWKTTVLDQGSKDQSFKLISISSGEFTHINYLEIHEFDEGIDKRFTGISGGTIHSGLCK